MALESPNETLAQLQKLSESNRNDLSQKGVRLQACELARKLWLELEETGDLIDRIVFQVLNNISQTSRPG